MGEIEALAREQSKITCAFPDGAELHGPRNHLWFYVDQGDEDCTLLAF